eukprot:197655_1
MDGLICIDQYLHWHHENTRRFTTGCLGVLLREDIDISKYNPSSLITTRKLAKYALDIIENVWLAKHEFIIDNRVSLTDILYYEEIVQLKQWNSLIPNAETKLSKYISMDCDDGKVERTR